jgi:hypothetical protein
MLVETLKIWPGGELKDCGKDLSLFVEAAYGIVWTRRTNAALSEVLNAEKRSRSRAYKRCPDSRPYRTVSPTHDKSRKSALPAPTPFGLNFVSALNPFLVFW